MGMLKNKQIDVLSGGGLDLLALLPCPVKIPFEQAFMECVDGADGAFEELLYCLEGHVNHHLSFYEQLDHTTLQAELPKILITPGVNRFMGQDFQKTFVQKGVFAREPDYFDRPDYLQNEFVDPNGYYFILAVNPLVIVADHTRLAGRPLPQTWEDLMSPVYKGQIAMRAQKDVFCETVLFNFYQEFQKDGIERLAQNVRVGCHPSEMAKNAGNLKNDGWPAISLMPYFFAKTIRHSNRVTIIWPEDGAIASPITMMVQQSALTKLKPVINILTSSAMAKLWTNAFFFPPFNMVQKSTKNNKLKWLGWDFIYSVDAHQMFEHLNEIFCRAMPEKPWEVLR